MIIFKCIKGTNGLNKHATSLDHQKDMKNMYKLEIVNKLKAGITKSKYRKGIERENFPHTYL